MTTDIFTSEGGSAGADITVANTATGSGLQLQGVVIGTFCTCTYESGAAHSGSLGFRAKRTASGTGGYRQWQLTTSATVRWGRAYIRPNGVPSGGTEFNYFQPRSNNSNGALFDLLPSGKLQIRNAAGAVVFTSAAAIDTGGVNWTRIEWRFAPGTTITTGGLEFKIFAGDSTTPIETMTPITAGNFGTSQITEFFRAGPQSGTTLGEMDIDDIAWSDTGYIGPLSVPAASVRPDALDSNPGLYVAVGAASIVAALADELDTSYAESVANPSATNCTVGFPEISAGPITVKVKHAADTASPAISRLYELKEGSTVISSHTFSPLPTTPTNDSWALTSPENAAIGDRSNLSLHWKDN